MSWEDLLLIGGLLMAIAVFSAPHVHAAPTVPHAITATAPAVPR